jgi:hypothetical protein
LLKVQNQTLVDKKPKMEGMVVKCIGV